MIVLLAYRCQIYRLTCQCLRPVFRHQFLILQAILKLVFEILLGSNSHFETNFECCSAVGAATLKIGFLKGSRRLPFKKPIFIMRIAAVNEPVGAIHELPLLAYLHLI